MEVLINSYLIKCLIGSKHDLWLDCFFLDAFYNLITRQRLRPEMDIVQLGLYKNVWVLFSRSNWSVYTNLDGKPLIGPHAVWNLITQSVYKIVATVDQQK